MAHIAETNLAQLEAMLAVASESWSEQRQLTTPVAMFMDLVVKGLPDVIRSVREYNEALRISHTAMRCNNWHEIKGGHGPVAEPLSAEDAFHLISSLIEGGGR